MASLYVNVENVNHYYLMKARIDATAATIAANAETIDITKLIRNRLRSVRSFDAGVSTN